MGVYVTAAEVIAEGAPASETTRINKRILKWERIVEEVTRNVFRVIEPGELIFDGANTYILHFNIPLVEVLEVKINGDTVALDSTLYRAFTGKTKLQEDRHNPKIELLAPDTGTAWYQKSAPIFYKGEDQRVTAKWGYVDDDPDNPGQYITPPPIKDIIIELVMMDLESYYDKIALGGGSVPMTPIRREKTDGHEIEYQMTEQQRVNEYGIPDQLYKQLMMFRAPIVVTMPDVSRYCRITGRHSVVSF